MKLFNFLARPKKLKIDDLEYIGGSSINDLAEFRKLLRAGKITEDTYNSYYAIVRLKKDL